MIEYKLTYSNGIIDYVTGRTEKEAIDSRIHRTHRVVKVELLNVDQVLPLQLFN